MTLPESEYTVIEDKQAKALLSLNDIHGNAEYVRQAIKQTYDAVGGKVAITISDISTHKHHREIYDALNIQSVKKPLSDYLVGSFSERELHTLQVGQQIQSIGGLEKFIEAVEKDQPGIGRQRIMEEIKPEFDYFVSAEFQGKVKQVFEDIPEEKRKEIDEQTLSYTAKNICLDQALRSLNLDPILEELANSEYVSSIVINPGNHDSKEDIAYIKQVLKGRVEVYDGSEVGVLKAAGMNIQLATNVAGMAPEAEKVMGMAPPTERYSHLYHAGYKEGITLESLANASQEDLANSPSYHRMKTEEKIDVFAFHAAPGGAIGDEDKSRFVDIGQDLGALESLLKNKRKDGNSLILSGHFHRGEKRGKDIYGNENIRAVATYVTKAKDGSLNANVVIGDVKEAPAPDIAYLRNFIAENESGVREQLLAMQQQEIAGKITPEEEKQQKQAA